LLQGIKHWNPKYLNEFIRQGAEPVPVDRPRRLRGAHAYLTYLALIAGGYLLVIPALAIAGALLEHMALTLMPRVGLLGGG
jgi:hypothetical protein